MVRTRERAEIEVANGSRRISVTFARARAPIRRLNYFIVSTLSLESAPNRFVKTVLRSLDGIGTFRADCRV